MEGFEKMTDGREATFAYWRRQQAAGDWIGVDLGGPVAVRRVRLAQGRDDRDHDRVHDGVLEGLGTDGQWHELARVREARVDVTLAPAVTLSQVRLRVLRPGIPGGKPDLWTAIRELEVNPVDVAEFRSSVPALRAATVRLADGVYSVSPGYEVHALPPGGQLGLLLPSPAEVRGVEVDLGASIPGLVLEGSADGDTWKPLSAKVNGTKLRSDASATLRAVRVRNGGPAAVQVTLKAFVLKTVAKPADPAELATDGLLSTACALSDQPLVVALPGGTRKVALLLSGDTAVVRVGVRRASGETPLAIGDPMAVELPTGAEALVLRVSPGSRASLHEVVSR